MQHYKNLLSALVFILTSVVTHAQVSGVDYCYQTLTEEQEYSLRIMMSDYGVPSCESLFAKAASAEDTTTDNVEAIQNPKTWIASSQAPRNDGQGQ